MQTFRRKLSWSKPNSPVTPNQRPGVPCCGLVTDFDAEPRIIQNTELEREILRFKEETRMVRNLPRDSFNEVAGRITHIFSFNRFTAERMTQYTLGCRFFAWLPLRSGRRRYVELNMPFPIEGLTVVDVVQRAQTARGDERPFDLIDHCCIAKFCDEHEIWFSVSIAIGKYDAEEGTEVGDQEDQGEEL